MQKVLKVQSHKQKNQDANIKETLFIKADKNNSQRQWNPLINSSLKLKGGSEKETQGGQGNKNFGTNHLARFVQLFYYTISSYMIICKARS